MKKRICLGAAVLIWMAVIFWFSSKTADLSEGQSDGVIAFFARLFDPAFQDMSPWEQQLVFDSWSFSVRKLGHFSEYAILGGLLVPFVESLIRRIVPAFFISAAAGALYALADEWHQTFVPGRSGRLTDVLIDAAGVLAGALIVLIVMVLIRRCLDKRNTV